MGKTSIDYENLVATASYLASGPPMRKASCRTGVSMKTVARVIAVAMACFSISNCDSWT